MPRDGSGIYSLNAGWPATTNTTIESADWNAFINDMATDANAARPIIAGGTGATSAAGARTNLQVERAMQVVTNYDSYAFETGSFFSNPGATAAPNGTDYFLGTAYASMGGNPLANVLQAVSLNTGVRYQRIQPGGGAWGAWQNAGAPGDFVLKAGDTMTGTLQIVKAAGTYSHLLQATGASTAAWGNAILTTGAYVIDEIGFATRLAIAPGGLVGINIIPSTYMLDVGDVRDNYFTMRLYNGHSGVNAAARLQAYNGSFSGYFGIRGVGSTALGALAPNTTFVAGDGPLLLSANNYPIIFSALNSFAEQMRLDPSGNVGIGTPSPAGKFNVAGGRSYFLANSEPFAIGVGFSNIGVSGYFGGASNGVDTVISNSSGTEIIRFANSGNVGIGTTTPGAKLDVNGNLVLSGGTAQISTTAGNLHLSPSGRLIACWDSVNAYNFGVYNGGTATIYLQAAGNCYFTSGFVGIGLNNPQARLHVSDTMRVDGQLRLYSPYARVEHYDAGGSLLWTAGTNNDQNYSIDRIAGSGAVAINAQLNTNAIVNTGNITTGALYFNATNLIVSDSVNLINRTNGGHYWQSGAGLSWGYITGGGLVIGAGAVPGAKVDIDASAGSNPTIRMLIGSSVYWNLYTQNTDGRFNFYDADASNGVQIGQNSNAWAAISDGRMKRKQNARTLDGMLERLSRFRLIEYDDEYSKVGVIAQEIDAFMPQLANRGDDSDIVIDKLNALDDGVQAWSVNPSDAAWVAMQCCKELLARVEKLEKRKH